jgi:hypothetical protein
MYELNSSPVGGQWVRTDRVPEHLDRQVLQGDTLSSDLHGALTMISHRCGDDRHLDIDPAFFAEPNGFRFAEGL